MDSILSNFIIFVERLFSFVIVGRVTVFDILFYMILIIGFFELFKIITKGGNREW